MRISLKELSEKLGVDHEISPYETVPWFYYDDEEGLTCSAEVRMGPDGDDLQAEIQFLRDPSDEDEDGEDEGEGGMAREQIMLMRAGPVKDSIWAPHFLQVKGKDYANELHDWEGKGCSFFCACIESMSMGETPDIDTLVEEHLSDDSFYGGGGRGKIGRKSPTIKPESILGNKGGM